MSEHNVVTVTEAARILGMSTSRVRTLCRLGAFDGSRYTSPRAGRGVWLIPIGSLSTYVERHPKLAKKDM